MVRRQPEMMRAGRRNRLDSGQLCLKCSSAVNCCASRRTAASGPLDAGALVHGGSARCPRSPTVDRRHRVAMTSGSRAGPRPDPRGCPPQGQGSPRGEGEGVVRSTAAAEVLCRVTSAKPWQLRNKLHCQLLERVEATRQSNVKM